MSTFDTNRGALAEMSRHTRCSLKRVRTYLKDGGGNYTEKWRVIPRNRDRRSS